MEPAAQGCLLSDWRSDLQGNLDQSLRRLKQIIETSVH